MSAREAALVALLVGRAAAAPPARELPPAPQFAIDELRVPGRLTAVHAEDVDGDGRRDLLALFSVGAPPRIERRVALFLNHRDRFSPVPDRIVTAPRDAAFVDLADVDGDHHLELLFGSARGLAYLGGSWDGSMHELADLPGLALLPDEEQLVFLDVARDWNGDGRDEILLPLVDRIAMLARGADGGWTRIGDLQLPPRASYSVRADSYDPRARNYWLRAVLTVPELRLGDFDGDGRADLFALTEDSVTVYRGGGALFEPAPALVLPLRTRSEAEVDRNSAVVQITVRDLDGDGVADLAVNKVTGGISAMEGRTAFYYGRRGGGYGEPRQLLAQAGFAGSLLFGDLDGDGLPELVLPHAAVGFAEAVRVMVARKLAMGFAVRRNLGAKGFADRPSIDLSIDLAVDYSGFAELGSPFPTLDGDFNGDGRPDLLGPHGTDALAVWLGGGKSLLAEYPKAIVHVPLSRSLQVVDLDGDRRADVVMFQRHRADRQGSITVLRNTGRGW